MAGFENNVVYADNVDFTGSTAPTAQVTVAGQLLIGTGSTPAISVGKLYSSDSSILVNYVAPNINLRSAAAPTPLTLTGNDLVAISPVANNFNLVTFYSTAKFSGTALTGTETLDFSPSNLLIGAPGSAISSGDFNVSLGQNSLQAVSSGAYNTALGYQALLAVTNGTTNIALGANAAASMTGDSSQIAIGYRALVTANGGSRNIAIGSQALTAATTGSRNVVVGTQAMISLLTGSYNIVLGETAASAYSTSESSNILISSIGVIGESNVTRIGTQGSGNSQQTQCYLAGVLNTLSGRVTPVTAIVVGQSPYTTLITDDVIAVASSGGAITIVPLGSPVTGTRYTIKDSTGNAAANNITVTPSGKNIDGAASFLITVNYGSITIVYSGTQWLVI